MSVANGFEMKIIARIHSDFPAKFGIPRQSGLVGALRSTIVFEPPYRDPNALRGIERYSHLWLLWQFSEAVKSDWSPTVRPPRLGGNTRMGVFATRSPYRPNSIGLSSVRLLEVVQTEAHGCVLSVGGADLMDGTPIFDIKPYLAFTDCHADAAGGFAADVLGYALEVRDNSAALDILPEDKREAARGILAQDPRPATQDDPERVYGVTFAGYDIKFRVSDGVLNVIELIKM